ncbi:hypothetical protein GGI12_005787 [Dipsacomyces acuminosporus]|nr:hypothetical protein GGI12_005787 [Dipsacomyces acuminosporus]
MASYFVGSLSAGSPLAQITDSRDKEEMERQHGSQTDSNVILTSAFIKGRHGEDILTRGISFVCGTVGLVMITAYINVMRDQSSQTVDIQTYKCILSNDENSAGAANSSVENRDTNSMYLIKSAYQACMVLEEMCANNLNPKIVFATDSINRILDVDSCDLQGEPFLSLVAMEDKGKAAAFLEKTLNDNDLVLERLHLSLNPWEDGQLADPRCVSVEFMAMGSDDGAIMLCQLEQPWISGRSENVGYISLEDIISSDPETSDFPDLWNAMEPY